MKGKMLWGFLAAEAAVCVFFGIMRTSFAGFFSSAMAFPFEQLGMALQTLSFSGRAGNSFAILIYAAVSLLPVVIIWKKQQLYAEDGLLGLLSAVLFAVLYLMVNPGLIGALMHGSAGIPTGKAILGGMVYSVLSGYLILRVLRLFFHSDIERLVRYMTVMLYILAPLFVLLAFGVCFGALLDGMAELRAGNSGNQHLLGASFVFLWLKFVVDALPHILNVRVIAAALELLGEMHTDRYSAAMVAAAGRMSSRCRAALAATVLSRIGFNLLQLLFAGSLAVINSSLEIPVFSIVFVLAALLFVRFAAENKVLKEDNDLFI